VKGTYAFVQFINEIIYRCDCSDFHSVYGGTADITVIFRSKVCQMQLCINFGIWPKGQISMTSVLLPFY
jgi:hypothetical protein